MINSLSTLLPLTVRTDFYLSYVVGHKGDLFYLSVRDQFAGTDLLLTAVH